MRRRLRVSPFGARRSGSISQAKRATRCFRGQGGDISNGLLKKEMENFYDAVVEPDRRLRLNTPVHLQQGLKVLVAVPRSNKDSAFSGIALSEPSLLDD